MSVRVSCPSCGGPVVFEVGSSMVAVCPYCRSAVARGDRAVEDLGKVAALVGTGAVLRVGLEGHHDGRKFRLTGRVQIEHEAGGVWDEWYAAFEGDRWGWLSESQGRYHLLFEQPPNVGRPALDDLNPGRDVPLPESPARFVVAETGTATAKGAEGEIPYRLVPGSTYPYADLSGTDRGFATLDYSESPPKLYLGKEVTLDELGVPANLRRETFELRQVAAKRANCPNCGGPLELRAPDKTERVGCPYCGSLLDATQGNLTLLNALKKPPFELILPLGAKGTFGSDERMVIGVIERSVRSAGVEYLWQEYLLYHPRDGFEWLIRSDNHWTRARSVPVADVTRGTKFAQYGGRQFRAFQAGTATVRGVVGECYWKVAINEQAETVDFIHPPALLSCESSRAGGSQEVNWTLGTYLTPAEVQAAFGLKEPLPVPEGIAPNQPFPYTRVYRFALAFFAALCVLAVVLLIALPVRKVQEQTFQLLPPASPTPGAVPPAPPAADKTLVFFTELFELKGRQNVRITISAPQLNGWIAVEGDLVQQSNGETQPFVLPLAHHSGTEDGETWAEGEREDHVYLPAQPPGQYSLRLEVERENAQVSGPINVRVEQGVPHFKNWLLALLGIGTVPLVIGIYHGMFVSRRWQNSDYPIVSTDPTPGEPGEPGDGSPPEEPQPGEPGNGSSPEVPRKRKKGRKGRNR